MSQTTTPDTTPNAAELRTLIKRWHSNEGGAHWVHPLSTLVHVGFMAAAVWTWNHELWPLTVGCWFICTLIGHAKVVAFHEASHGTLHPRPLVNEFQGIMLGNLILIPLSVYRAVHAHHHAYISSDKDYEFWPFVDTRVSLGRRRLAAASELLFGFFHSPLVFLRGVLKMHDLPTRQKVRIALEYALMIGMWVAAFVIIERNDWWTAFLVGYFVPAFLTGNVQALNRYIEHMGLVGNTPLTNTRTVVDKSLLGYALSWTWLHIDYHGTHHRYAKIPYYHLPEATPHVYDGSTPAVPIFSSYWEAAKEMVRTLHDPRIGGQWEKSAATK
ncbi:MAG: fatty acid desaturase [Planctomycetaceae bacterium]|nr:fatty acid desaturase [Planctomycetaceae bacterium]